MQFGAMQRAMFWVVVRRRLWLAANRRRIARVLARSLASADREGLNRVAERYGEMWDVVGPEKYTNYKHWIAEAVVRALRLNLDRKIGLRILDLGSGTGYFVHTARTLGHGAEGLDLGDVPIYNEVFDLLELPRTIHRITPENPIPAGKADFDLITGYMVTFNGVDAEWEWGVGEWNEFLSNTLPHLKVGGEIFLSLNFSFQRNEFYDSETAKLLDFLPNCTVRRLGNEVLIRREA